MPDVRPLDRITSVKVKLGVLVVASVGATALVLWYSLTELGWLPRYTVPASILVALAVTQVLARGMTSPLRELTAAARAMAGGDYTRRVRASGRDEIGQAGRAFNRMAEDLQTVDRQRRELVANVSHELRTPISALHAVLENLVDGVTRPDPATLGAALEQTERLGRLVAELLDLSRLDAGVVPLDREDVDLGELLAAGVRETEMTRRPVSFAVDVQPPGLLVWADRARLHQVVANLLDNASRHSPQGAVVSVAARTSGSGVRLEIADQGPGIPVEERARVFERFSRGDDGSGGPGVSGPGVSGPGVSGPGVSGPGGDGGTGLGLAIARWLVDLHGGSLGIADTPVGCRFFLELPGRPA